MKNAKKNREWWKKKWREKPKKTMITSISIISISKPRSSTILILMTIKLIRWSISSKIRVFFTLIWYRNNQKLLKTLQLLTQQQRQPLKGQMEKTMTFITLTLKTFLKEDSLLSKSLLPRHTAIKCTVFRCLRLTI